MSSWIDCRVLLGTCLRVDQTKITRLNQLTKRALVVCHVGHVHVGGLLCAHSQEQNALTEEAIIALEVELEVSANINAVKNKSM
jgi:hypothetical protein